EQVEIGHQRTSPHIQVTAGAKRCAMGDHDTYARVERLPQPQRVAEVLAEAAYRALVARVRNERQAQVSQLAVEAVAARGRRVDALRRRQPLHRPPPA